ncbi:MAG: NifB/NifX family molybdenum-iron cluster-binding protein [Candidatus Bathyarchaeia archaeon]
MKLCVTSTGPDLNALVDPRFGRCAYFIVVDIETMKFEALPNPGGHSMRGAGIQAAQIIANKGVDVVITGQVGPNAYQVLSTAGIEVITGGFGTVKEVIEKYKSGELQAMTTSTFGLKRMYDRKKAWSNFSAFSPSTIIDSSNR